MTDIFRVKCMKFCDLSNNIVYSKFSGSVGQHKTLPGLIEKKLPKGTDFFRTKNIGLFLFFQNLYLFLKTSLKLFLSITLKYSMMIFFVSK